jgi:hypothetical protein
MYVSTSAYYCIIGAKAFLRTGHYPSTTIFATIIPGVHELQRGLVLVMRTKQRCNACVSKKVYTVTFYLLQKTKIRVYKNICVCK